MYADSSGHFAIITFLICLGVGVVAGAWYGGAGLWNIPKGIAPGLGNFAVKLYLNSVIGTGLKLTVDAIYALILKEKCGWINVLRSILRRIF